MLPYKNTYQIIRARYTEYQYFIVPKEWNIESIDVKMGYLYHRGFACDGSEDVDMECHHDTYSEFKRPDSVEVVDYPELFDCIPQQHLLNK
jgi:hypothetical protein